MKRLLALVTMILLLTSCGGGGGNSVSIFETPTFTAYYIDAPVKGLTYFSEPSGLTGQTDEKGTFKFKDSDTVYIYLDSSKVVLISEIKPLQNVRYFLGQKISNSIELSILPFVFSALDIAPVGSDYIDVSDLPYTSSNKLVLKNILSRTYFSESNIANLFANLEGVRNDLAGVIFKNSNLAFSDIDALRQRIYTSLLTFESMIIPSESVLGTFLMDEGGGFYMGSIDSNGFFNYFNLKSGSVIQQRYELNQRRNKITQRGYFEQSLDCIRTMELRSMLGKVEVYSFVDDITAIGCDDSNAATGAILKYKIKNNNEIIEYIGKDIFLSAKALCGEAILKMSFSGTAAAPLVSMDLRPCNIDYIGTLSVLSLNSVDGVYYVEITNVSPRVRIAFGFIDDVVPLIATSLLFERGGGGGYDDEYNAVTTFTVH